jgi:membrane-associated protein
VLVVANYAAGLIHGMPWLKAVALWASIAFFVVGTLWGVFRYRQEIHKPIETVTVGAEAGD